MKNKTFQAIVGLIATASVMGLVVQKSLEV
jgi:hypothetical protein